MENLGSQDVEPEFNPGAIGDYYFLDYEGVEKDTNRDILMKAKKHLSAVGWTFPYIYKKTCNRKEIRYVPPNGKKKFLSLRAACKGYLESQNQDVGDIKFQDWNKKKGLKNLVDCEENAEKVHLLNDSETEKMPTMSSVAERSGEIGETKPKDSKKRRICSTDVYGERMLKCMQGIMKK